MKKEEVVHLHELLVRVKECFEENSMNCEFEKYNELDITPLDMQRSKKEHKRAIFVLASELASKAAKKLSCGKKTLLIFYEGMGKDICDPDVFDEIVEKARQDLGEKRNKRKYI